MDITGFINARDHPISTGSEVNGSDIPVNSEEQVLFDSALTGDQSIRTGGSNNMNNYVSSTVSDPQVKLSCSNAMADPELSKCETAVSSNSEDDSPSTFFQNHCGREQC